jgi:hypothetical protein
MFQQQGDASAQQKSRAERLIALGRVGLLYIATPGFAEIHYIQSSNNF